jgi:beta-glucosidase-like glycosyl hydrolase
MAPLRTALALCLASAALCLGQPPIDTRVASLLAQMTPSEKVAQLFYTGFPTKDPAALLKLLPLGIGGLSLNDLASRNAIQAAFMSNATRLGIPVSFYAESLRSGGVNNATIFPMPALIGSSWNLSLAYHIGRVVATELYASGGDRSFSPVLQVTTDPRFGRFDENFGECELLVALMGSSMTRGLSNNNGGGPDTYLDAQVDGNFSVIAYAKRECIEARQGEPGDVLNSSPPPPPLPLPPPHLDFLAYGASNADGFTVSRSPAELRDIYWKPWREFVAAGGRGAMVAHPAVNGIPMHANAALLGELRALAPGFAGALLGSDNENVRWLSEAFRYSASDAAAAADALVAGVDQEMDNYDSSLYLTHLPAAAAANATVAAALDRAAGNVLRAKFAAGLFDAAPARDATLPARAVRTPAAAALNRQAVLQGAVLLTNAGGALPLSPAALAAPTARIALLGPNAGAGCPADTAQGCTVRANMVGSYSAYAAAGSNGATRVPTLYDALGARFPAAALTLLRGAPIDGAAAYNYSEIAAAAAAAAAADVVVLALGDSACVGTGFGVGSCCEGGDRVSLDLPGAQLALLRAVLNATGNLAGLVPPDGLPWVPFVRPGGAVPVAVVLIHGRPATFGQDNWLLPGAAPAARAALVSAWLPAEAGAEALVDLLTGVENFSGRTAATWPRSAGHVATPGHPWLQAPNSQGSGLWLPPREGLSGGGGTWAPLFQLGYGLDYTRWQLSALVLPPAPLPAASGGSFVVGATLTNAGSASGAAVVFVAYSVAVEGVMRYARRVAGFARARVAAGQAASVAVTVRVGDLERWDERAQAYVVDAGVYTLYIGTCLVGTGVLPDGPQACQQLTGQVTLE